jgi:stage IV sporulation protein FB
MRRQITLGRLAGVPVSVHWTLVAATAVLLAASVGSVGHFAGAVIGILAYFATMLVHEGGHAFLARRRRHHVLSIDLYPFVGVTRIQYPRTRLDRSVIAWGGVLFQGALGIPMVVWILAVGYTPVEVVNAFMAMFGYLTVLMVPVNLIPVEPLDGAAAWDIVPLAWARLAAARRPTGRRPARRTKLRLLN